MVQSQEFQRKFKRNLRCAIRVHWGERRRLVDCARGGCSVDSGTGRENHALHPNIAGGVQQVEARLDVVRKVTIRVLVALGHDALGAAVHDDVNTRVAEELLHLVRFAVAPCLEGGLIRNGVGVAAGEIVQDDDAMSFSEEGIGGGGAW